MYFCRHKRKMPNFWPCKSLPKRNGHLDTSGVSTGGHSVAYEDPDAHLHHHPLVRHHNMEVIVWKNPKISYCFASSESKNAIKSNYIDFCHRKIIQLKIILKLNHCFHTHTHTHTITHNWIELTNHYFLIEWKKKRARDNAWWGNNIDARQQNPAANEFVKILWFNVSTHIHTRCMLPESQWMKMRRKLNLSWSWA